MLVNNTVYSVSLQHAWFLEVPKAFSTVMYKKLYTNTE